MRAWLMLVVSAGAYIALVAWAFLIVEGKQTLPSRIRD